MKSRGNVSPGPLPSREGILFFPAEPFFTHSKFNRASYVVHAAQQLFDRIIEFALVSYGHDTNLVLRGQEAI